MLVELIYFANIIIAIGVAAPFVLSKELFDYFRFATLDFDFGMLLFFRVVEVVELWGLFYLELPLPLYTVVCVVNLY